MATNVYIDGFNLYYGSFNFVWLSSALRRRTFLGVTSTISSAANSSPRSWMAKGE